MTASRMSKTQFRDHLLTSARRGSKYGNVKIEVDGIRFDSKAEAAFYGRLKQREKLSEVSGVELQRPFPLLVGPGIVVGSYRADFAFWDHVEDRFRVVDIKGGRATKTAVFRLKKKIVEALYGVKVECLTAEGKAI